MALDLSELEAELSRTRRKVQDWAASRMQLAGERKDQHLALMQDQTEKLNNLQGMRAQLQVATEHTNKRLQSEEQELRRMQDSMASASTAASTTEQQLESVQTQLRRLQEEYRQRIAELEGGQRQKQRQLDRLRQELARFGERFSLQFRHGQDELCLVMTHVDAFEHGKEFCLSVRILNNVYQVTKCEPPVPSLEELITEVNKTNDFAAFVKAVRAGFVQVARASHGL
ncbi:Kinetochore protein spc25 [Tetrabaena socialis]|uniref:Kinetochore protein SPC25 n=1 Tax=Tetrabaena socialis TaxID=47790 RepID=A0A2J7ZU58_9CHLO|nr:Kinetochore protein spc25 [Tetrabaena socialis]|eukprot:PNH03811.1 Kinetochore protein spc25 [Tetrabaena socialis]